MVLLQTGRNRSTQFSHKENTDCAPVNRVILNTNAIAAETLHFDNCLLHHLHFKLVKAAALGLYKFHYWPKIKRWVSVVCVSQTAAFT